MQRRTDGVFLRIFPGILLELTIPARTIRRTDKGVPVDDGPHGHGGSEPVGMADDPCREHTAPAAAAHEEVVLVDESFV